MGNRCKILQISAIGHADSGVKCLPAFLDPSDMTKQHKWHQPPGLEKESGHPVQSGNLIHDLLHL